MYRRSWTKFVCSEKSGTNEKIHIQPRFISNRQSVSKIQRNRMYRTRVTSVLSATCNQKDSSKDARHFKGSKTSLGDCSHRPRRCSVARKKNTRVCRRRATVVLCVTQTRSPAAYIVRSSWSLWAHTYAYNQREIRK